MNKRGNQSFDLMSDVLGATIWMAIVWFAFVVLFAPEVKAGDWSPESYPESSINLQHEPSVRELAMASETAATELVELRKDLRLQLQKRLDSEIELDFELIPETPLVSAARKPIAETGEL
jgi:hypothetical protein